VGQLLGDDPGHCPLAEDVLAEIAAEYLRKGSQCYVEGRIQTRKWQGQDGQDRYTTEVVANEMQLLGSRGGGGGAAPPRGREEDSGSAWPAGRSTGTQPAAPRSGPSDDFDDDIPF